MTAILPVLNVSTIRSTGRGVAGSLQLDGHLLDRPGPVAVATGTDLSTGSRLAFFRNDFDLLCSDLNTVRPSRAAATSSAVPIVLSPVTFNNYGGTCGSQ